MEWVITEGEEQEARTFSVVKEGYEPMELGQPPPDSDVTIGIPLSPIETKEDEESTKKPFIHKGGGGKDKKPPEKDGTGKEKGTEGLKLIHDYPDL